MGDFETSTADVSPGLPLGSQLCTQCGLCCVGALHKAAVLDADEVSAAQALGLPVLERDKPGFALPCPRLDGAVCTIYEQRPRVCGRYKCRLLQDAEAGRVPLGEALEKVSIAKNLLADLEAVLPVDVSLNQIRSMGNKMEQMAVSDNLSDGEVAVLKLRVISLMYYLDNHFRNSREGKMLGSGFVSAEIEDKK